MANVKDYIIYHLGESDAEIFAQWAWGDSYKELELCGDEITELWNSRHEIELKIFPEGDPATDIPLMIELWKKETCKNKD